jgi:DNA-binding response OmpR family regulator
MDTLKKYALLSFQRYDAGQNLKSILEQSGFQVHITVGGLEALKLLYRRGKIDLLITELCLDAISGFALIQAAKGTCRDGIIAINNGAEILDEIALNFGASRVMKSSTDVIALFQKTRHINQMDKNQKLPLNLGY